MKTAILVDNMYLQNVVNEYGLSGLKPSLFSTHLLEPGEEHYMTYIFDALPYPIVGATPVQREIQRKKSDYIEAIQYYKRIKVELGYVATKPGRCPRCGETFMVPVQKQVDVKISVRIMSLAWERIVEKIVLLSGDGDLLPAVRAIEPTGVIIRLVYGRVGRISANKGLIKECPEKVELTREKLEAMTFRPNTD